MTRIFVRDGFIDRYRGTRLVFPPTLRILSQYLPLEFPYHKNGKMTEGHLAYWELFPTIDHIQPVARGGLDSEVNRVCCSMLTNSIKSNWTLEQLQWELLPQGDINDWDGMMCWFLNQIDKDKSLLQIPYLKTWWLQKCRLQSIAKFALNLTTVLRCFHDETHPRHPKFECIQTRHF